LVPFQEIRRYLGFWREFPAVIFPSPEVTDILCPMRTISLALFLLVSGAVAPRAGYAQSDPTNGSRKVINRVIPEYPHLARDMNLTGAVRLEVVVNANGTVKAIQVKGGSPLLVQSARLALNNWRWEKLDHETAEQIEFNFKP
jgi:TonB family protein